MHLVLAGDTDMVATYPTSCVKKSADLSPFIVDLDLLEKRYTDCCGHLGGSSAGPPIESPIKRKKTRITRVFDDLGDRAAF
jgi:hypothetical protein